MFSRIRVLVPRLAPTTDHFTTRLYRRSYVLHNCGMLSQRQRRMMSTPPPQVNISALPMDRYHALSDTTMDSLLESLETLLDDLANTEYEVEYHSGVLTLSLGDKGTYVINKQPPNKQIWLSSPFSGPKRYDYSDVVDDWLYSRDRRAMGDLLNEELSKALDRKVDIGLEGPASQLGQ